MLEVQTISLNSLITFQNISNIRQKFWAMASSTDDWPGLLWPRAMQTLESCALKGGPWRLIIGKSWPQHVPIWWVCPICSWRILYIYICVWKRLEDSPNFRVYPSLSSFATASSLWTWAVWVDLPTGGCPACRLPSSAARSHRLQPRGFLFQKPCGWVKTYEIHWNTLQNLWNTLFLYLAGDEEHPFIKNFGVKGGFDPQRRSTLPSVSVTTSGQIQSALVRTGWCYFLNGPIRLCPI